MWRLAARAKSEAVPTEKLVTLTAARRPTYAQGCTAELPFRRYGSGEIPTTTTDLR